jgi:uncharacterized RDD family membrane protein YckC
MAELKGDATKTRFFAAWIDNTLAFILCLVVGSKLAGPFSSVGRWSIAGVAFLVYFFVQEGMWGTTLGKRIFDLRVVRLDGRAPGWTASLLRTFPRLIEVNPVLLGGLPAALTVAWSRRKQRMGDMLAHTVVIKGERTARTEAARA